MIKFDGYDEVKARGEFDSLKLGGHICKILEVTVENYTTKDKKEFQQLVLKIDIDEPDEQAGFYSRKFAEDAKTDALNAKWKGFYRISIPKNDSEDFIKSNFKTLITSVEKSNPGYDWKKSGYEENTLVGKIFGGVFGLEEFTTDDGRVLSNKKCRFIRSTEKIDEIGIPKVKLADGTYMDYEEYSEKRKAERNAEKGNINTDIKNETKSEFASMKDLPF